MHVPMTNRFLVRKIKAFDWMRFHCTAAGEHHPGDVDRYTPAR